MSGGNPSKKQSRSGNRKQQGWEEAGGDFYQETYPGLTEPGLLDLQSADANKLATLLPSKKVRAATVRRVRSQSERRQSTTARSTATRDVHISMLPDLSENLSNEERTWEEIMQIKATPVPMAQKRDMKVQLQNATKLRLQGMEQLQWRRRKAWQQTRNRWREALDKLELWGGDMKSIEGNFGTGVVAYFLFIRWLLFLNLGVSAVVVLFLVVPATVFVEPPTETCDLDGDLTNQTVVCCTEYSVNATDYGGNVVLDFIQGSGWMEQTILFYGVYANTVLQYVVNSDNWTVIYYNIPVAYILVPLVYFLLSLAAIMKSAARGLKERLVEGEGQFYLYCNLVFGGWDFCIHNEKSAINKHRALYNEIRGCLEEERMQEERQARSREEHICLIIKRIIINLLIIALLTASAFLIYFVFEFTLAQLNVDHGGEDEEGEMTMRLNNANGSFGDPASVGDVRRALNASAAGPNSTERSPDASALRSFIYNKAMRIEHSSGPSNLNNLLTLVLQYLPSTTIVTLNMVVPMVYEHLTQYENYSPNYELKMTLMRTVFLRLSSLAVLLLQVRLLIRDTPDTCVLLTGELEPLLCWETYLGQQLYKLIITGFVMQCVTTFLVNFPRAMLARRTENRFVKLVAEQQFAIPKHVLDIVYVQTIVWMGAFFSPFLPVCAVVFYFLIFYVKKFTCLVNSTPSPTVYRASRSKSLFMYVLLVSFAIALAPVAYSITEVRPSVSCGPFRGFGTAWEQVVLTFEGFPEVLRRAVLFLGTSLFAVPLFVALGLLLYYYWAVAHANRHMVSVLRSQLVLEGHDKQFLLDRLSAFIRQHQKRCERADRHNVRASFADDDSTRQSPK